METIQISRQDELRHLAHFEKDLLQSFADLPPTVVRSEWRRTVKSFEDVRVRAFVPVLAFKKARQHLQVLDRRDR